MDNQKPMNIEQAGNYLKEKIKTMPADIKKQAKAEPISVAPPKDRINYLMYGIAIMTDVSETIKNKWCVIANKAPGMYTTKEVCGVLRKILVLRINGYSTKQISHHLKTPELAIIQSEALAVQAISQAIEQKQATGVPILGGVRG